VEGLQLCIVSLAFAFQLFLEAIKGVWRYESLSEALSVVVNLPVTLLFILLALPFLLVICLIRNVWGADILLFSFIYFAISLLAGIGENVASDGIRFNIKPGGKFWGRMVFFPDKQESRQEIAKW